MDLDGSKLKSPLVHQRKKILREHVDKELARIKKKILLANTVGVSEIVYKIYPSFTYPDPSIPEEWVVAELREKHFLIHVLPDHVLKIMWGERMTEVSEETSADSSRSRNDEGTRKSENAFRTLPTTHRSPRYDPSGWGKKTTKKNPWEH